MGSQELSNVREMLLSKNDFDLVIGILENLISTSDYSTLQQLNKLVSRIWTEGYWRGYRRSTAINRIIILIGDKFEYYDRYGYQIP